MGLFLVQSAYESALGRLLDDLAVAAVPHEFTVTVDFSATFDAAGVHPIDAVEGTDLPYFFVAHDGTKKHWSALVPTEDEEEAAICLAIQFQDDVLQELRGTAWPRCGEHPHPADPRLIYEVATWCCPMTGSDVGRIGELQS